MTFCAVIVMHRHITAVFVTSVLQFPVLSVLIPVPESRKSQYGFPYSRHILIYYDSGPPFRKSAIPNICYSNSQTVAYLNSNPH